MCAISLKKYAIEHWVSIYYGEFVQCKFNYGIRIDIGRLWTPKHPLEQTVIGSLIWLYLKGFLYS